MRWLILAPAASVFSFPTPTLTSYADPPSQTGATGIYLLQSVSPSQADELRCATGVSRLLIRSQPPIKSRVLLDICRRSGPVFLIGMVN